MVDLDIHWSPCGSRFRPMHGDVLRIHIYLYLDNRFEMTDESDPDANYFIYKEPHQLFFHSCRDFVHTFLSSKPSYIPTSSEVERVTNEIDASIRKRFPSAKQDQKHIAGEPAPAPAAESIEWSDSDIEEEFFCLYVHIVREVQTREFERGKDCAICLEGFGDDEDHGMEVMMHCGHPFHLNCIANCLHKCPLCRKPFTKPEIKELRRKIKELDNDWKNVNI